MRSIALSEIEKRFYQDQGYLVVEGAIAPDRLAELRTAIAQMLEQAKSVQTRNEIYEFAPEHRLGEPCVRRIISPHLHHPAFDALMRCPEIVDRVADLLGGTVRFDHSKLNFKPPGGQSAIEWHQDWPFYPHTNDDLLAAGVMVEDCMADNGPLMVLPGSHRGRVYDHHLDGNFVGAIDPAALAAKMPDAVSLTAPAGSISFHHVRTVHGSRNNASSSMRPLLLFSYAAVNAFPVSAPRDLAAFDAQILRGSPTLEARQVALPVPLHHRETASIFDAQDQIVGRS